MGLYDFFDPGDRMPPIMCLPREVSPRSEIIELKRETEQLRRKFVKLDKRVAELEKHNDISRTDKS